MPIGHGPNPFRGVAHHRAIAPTMLLDRLSYRGDTVELTIPITVTVTKEGFWCSVRSEELHLSGHGHTVRGALADFSCRAFDSIVMAEQYGREANPKLDALIRHVVGYR